MSLTQLKFAVESEERESQLTENRETVHWKHVSRKEIHLYGIPTR